MGLTATITHEGKNSGVKMKADAHSELPRRAVPSTRVVNRTSAMLDLASPTSQHLALDLSQVIITRYNDLAVRSMF